MKKVCVNNVTLWTSSTGHALALTSAAHLCDEERARERRIKVADDRRRFVAARALLRHALSEASDHKIAPQSWRYVTGPQGKPVMAPELPPLEFSLSHAGDCVAVGVGSSGAIGVDVESAIRDERLGIVHDVLTTQEREYLSGLPDNRQWQTFLQFWTLKEACAKALGLGATLDFRSLEVVLDPLCVVAPKGLLGRSETFVIETREFMLEQMPYRLGFANIVRRDPRQQIIILSL